ncbi:uncharacterized protein B0T23DRAFT_168626 [Neurospora hispaniola]|uniref:Uncharacterized protein n=1 Tax=Neurospora hispaniola TaxID=588809 RepID=A0AAJ0MQC6_9PEZI|nr:hypothetical protein B0T23DRAFT_168626 [Neurospora hispaniola]
MFVNLSACLGSSVLDLGRAELELTTPASLFPTCCGHCFDLPKNPLTTRTMLTPHLISCMPGPGEQKGDGAGPPFSVHYSWSPRIRQMAP